MENQNPQENSASMTPKAVKGLIREGGIQIAKATVKSTFPIIIETTGKTMRMLAAIALRLLRR